MGQVKRSVFQVKFTIKREKYKSFVVSGFVFAEDRVTAVGLATNNLADTMAAIDKSSQIKLLSAATLQTDFFLMSDLKENINNENK